MSNDMDHITHSASASSVVATKLGIAWGGWWVSSFLGNIGLNSWQDFAGMCAGLLSLGMFAHLMWKWWREWRSAK